MKLVRLFIRQHLILLTIYSLLRLCFFIYNYNDFVQIPFSHIFAAFIYGLRFDWSVVVILYFPYLLYVYFRSILPENIINRKADQIFLWLYCILQYIFISINLADLEWVRFVGQRATVSSFGNMQDVVDQIPQLLQHYWYFSAIAIVLIVVLNTLFKLPKRFDEYRSKWNFTFHPLAIFLYLIFFVVSVRGGFQNKPLRPAQAFTSASTQLGNLVLNSSFTLIHASKAKPEKRIRWLTEQELTAALSKNSEESCLSSVKKPLPKNTNVMIILLESFAAEFTGIDNNGVGFTPNFDQMANESLFFKNAYANGRRSIEAIPSVLAAMPSVLSDAFLTSKYQSTRLLSFPKLFHDIGYKTLFFHGAENGTMFFDSFAQRIGIEEYVGLSEYPVKSDYDGTWGIFDEPFFKFTKSKLDATKEPFMSALFSLSSHQPFTIPKQYAGRFPKGELPIMEAIGYTDNALKIFFDEAKKSSWYDNTLFIITADHTTKSVNPKYTKHSTGAYRVPLLFYHPSMDLKKQFADLDLEKPVQHSDIMYSIVDLLGVNLDIKKTFTGCSVFSPAHMGVVNRNGSHIWFLNKRIYGDINLTPDEYASTDIYTERVVAPQKFSPLHPTQFDSQDVTDIDFFRAYVQRMINGIIDDQIL